MISLGLTKMGALMWADASSWDDWDRSHAQTYQYLFASPARLATPKICVCTCLSLLASTDASMALLFLASQVNLLQSIERDNIVPLSLGLLCWRDVRLLPECVTTYLTSLPGCRSCSACFRLEGGCVMPTGQPTSGLCTAWQIRLWLLYFPRRALLSQHRLLT